MLLYLLSGHPVTVFEHSSEAFRDRLQKDLE